MIEVVCSENTEKMMHISQETAYFPCSTMHISHEPTHYLKHKLHQLAYEQLGEQSSQHEETLKKDPQKMSNVSLLTMFLSSPSKTCPSEMTSLDLSDHESTSGHSTPTLPFMFHFMPKSGVKFVAKQPKTNVHEVVRRLSPILQQPYFLDVSHADQTAEKPQQHVRFMTIMDSKESGAVTQSSKSLAPLWISNGSTSLNKTKRDQLQDINKTANYPLSHGELIPKPAVKILLDNVLPKEKMNLIEIEDEEQMEDDDESPSSINQTYNDYDHYKNFESKTSNIYVIKNNFFDSILHKDMVTASDPLQNNLKLSKKKIKPLQSFLVSSSQQADCQDNVDFILGNLDEDQSISSETDYTTHTSMNKSKVVTPHDIDPTFPYSDTEESDSGETSFVRGRRMLYHYSPPIKMKHKKKSLSIKSLPV